VPDPVTSASDAELRSHVERTLAATYEIDNELGRGGMGIVYRARDKRLKRVVAIKLLPPELAFRSEIRSRFLREAETSAALSHPNIVPIYSVDEKDGLVFFVMQFVDGDNLGKRIQATGPMDVGDVRRILGEVASALSLAHSRGVVHRDIKPDNILLNKEDGRAMVTDFGIARAISEGADSRLTATGVAIGTPHYMSPEQCAGDRDVDGRADLYSLGIVGYLMLTGELPFSAGTTPALLVKQISEIPTPVERKRAGVPEDLARIVMRLLEKDPANRFPDAAALEQALESGIVPDQPRRASVAPLAPMDLGQYGGSSSNMANTGYGVMSRTSGMTSPLPAYGASEPTQDEVARWYAEPVVKFRRKLAPYLAVNGVFLFFAIFTSTNLLGVSAIWSVVVAYQYAKIWSEGFDWRDVFKQPRDRLFFDVVAEWIDDAKALFDPQKRAELRDRTRAQRQLARERGTGGLFDGPSPRHSMGALGAGATGAPPAPGPQGDIVRSARSDRDEILRLINTMPASERNRVADVASSARALTDRIEALGALLADLERNATPGALEVIDREIVKLESEANPLDRTGSEDRIRRLAYLKRQRRAVSDIGAKRASTAARLESCRTALQSMRFDMLRLRTGTQDLAGITMMAEQALVLAREVDGMVAGTDAARGLAPRGRA
jgi:serine/threonine-protein kinase